MTAATTQEPRPAQTAEALRAQLRAFLAAPFNLRLYFLLQPPAGPRVLRLADLDNGRTTADLRTMFAQRLQADLLGEPGLPVLPLSGSDERREALYHYDLAELPPDLAPFASYDYLADEDKIEAFSFRQDDLNQLRAYVIALGSADRRVLLYKQHYAISLIKRSSLELAAPKRTLALLRAKSRFVKLEGDILRLNDDYQFLRLGDALYIRDLSVLERFYGYHQIVKEQARQALRLIAENGLLEDLDVLQEALEEVRFARKLVKIGASPVLRVPSAEIIAFTKTTDELQGMFKYSAAGDKIRLDTKKSREAFLKLLNDDFLWSELSRRRYDSLAKDLLRQPRRD